MSYLCYRISTQPEMAEIVMAFLGEMPFDSFEEQPEGLNAYIPEKLHDPSVDGQVGILAEQFGFEFQKEHIPYKNWNEVWESQFQPIKVGNFVGIRANFHPPFEKTEYDIVINPEMAFGTGHHATTHMMMQLMENIPFRGKTVLDYGCGTGILAILAHKLGAIEIDAVDIEAPAVRNTRENMERNQTQFHIMEGDLKVVPPKIYQTILANINRNVILESLKTLHQMTDPGNVLLLSGILETDEHIIKQALLTQGFLPFETLRRGKWIAIKTYRRY